MKKMFAKLGMPSILSVVFMLGGLLFGANRATAQTLSGTQPESPIKTNGVWKSPNAAKDALLYEINGLTNLLNTSNPGNGLVLKAQTSIYEQILIALEGGATVPMAAFNGFYQFAPGQPGADTKPGTFGISNSDWTWIYNSMIDVLQL